jgi:hypothetical protein
MVTDSSAQIRTDKAYRLSRNIDYLGKDEAVEEGAWLINYPNAPDSGIFWRITDSLNLPERIEFEAVGSLLAKTDYPLTDVRWPIMSRAMLSTLLSVGNFPYRAYPVVMLDVVEVYDPKSKKYVSPRTENNNYVAVQLTEYLDAFDIERSVYEKGKINPNVIVDVQWLVLKELENGFPPLFILDDSPLDLFVSAEARAALEAANIQGIDFQHVEDGVPL